MGSVERRQDSGTWRARWRTPDGRSRSKAFTRRGDAERYLVQVESSKPLGSYVDPGRSRVTVGTWGQQWIAGQAHLKPSSRERYHSTLREHVEPRWGNVRLGNVAHSEVQSWVADLSTRRSPSTVRKAHRVLSLVLASAVKDGRLARNPADGVRLPRVVDVDRMFLTHDDVDELAAAAGDDGIIITFLAYTGCRFGEMAALRVRRVDPLRRRIEVAEAVTAVNGALVWGTPKGHATRWISLPGFLADLLAEHVLQARRRPGVHLASGGTAAREQLPPRRVQSRRGRVRSGRCHSAFAAPHCGEPGYRVRRQREGGPVDARPQVGDDDVGSVRASDAGCARAGSRRDGRQPGRCRRCPARSTR